MEKMNKHLREFLKMRKERHDKRLASFKGGKSREKQRLNYLVARGMMNFESRQRSE